MSIRIARLIVCGGGQHNKTMVDKLELMANSRVYTANSLKLPGDHIEAELMGFLAARFCHDLPATFPHTTGASKSCVAGRLQKATRL